MKKKITKSLNDIFQDKINFNLDFNNINNQIDYDSLIIKKKAIQKRRTKIIAAFASVVIVLFSCLSFSLSHKTNEPENEYFKILNSNDFSFYIGAQCPLKPTLQNAILNQKAEYRPTSFYKVEVLEMDNLFTGAYIPSNYYDKYYESYAEYSDMTNYTHTNEFFYFYKNKLRSNPNAKKIIWKEYNDVSEVKNKLDNDYKLVMLLRSRNVTVLTNETKNREVNSTKRIYISTPFKVIEKNKISPFYSDSLYDLANLKGQYLWAQEEKYMENDEVAFRFSTLSTVKACFNLFNYEDTEVISLPIYRRLNSDDELYYMREEFGIFFDDILNTNIVYKTIDNQEYMYCDYQEISKVFYK